MSPAYATSTDASALVPPSVAQRVLVVEDDPSVADLLELVLTRDGYDVVVADTGSAALRHALEGDFAAVLLDLMIPAPDGVEVLRRLRAAGRSTPVMFLTAKSTAAARESAIRAGADAYLTKPVSPAQLTERVLGLTTAPRLTPMERANALRGVTVRGAGSRPGRAPRPRAPWLDRSR